MDPLAEDTDLIRRLVAYTGLASAQVAKRAGISASTLNRPYNGTATTRLGRQALEKLRSAFPDFPGWEAYFGKAALTEQRRPYKAPPREGRSPVKVRADEDMVAVGSIDLRFGLGAALMDEEVTDRQVETMHFPRAWLRMITTSPPSMLYWAVGQGNSMEPAIGDGDIILIDRSDVTPGFGDLYWAFAYGQTGMVKRLRPMPDGSVKILSDNQSVPPELAYDGELHIFGRVIAVVRKM